jgi:hypothetical protein
VFPVDEPVGGSDPETPPVPELVVGADDVVPGELVVVSPAVVVVSPAVVVVSPGMVVVVVVVVVVVDVVGGGPTMSSAVVSSSGTSLLVGRNDAFSAAAPSCAPVAVNVIVPVCPPAAGCSQSQEMDEAVLLQLISCPDELTDESVKLPVGSTVMSTLEGRGSPAVVLTVSVTLVDAPTSSWVWATENDPVVSALAGLAPNAWVDTTTAMTATPKTERRTAPQ